MEKEVIRIEGGGDDGADDAFGASKIRPPHAPTVFITIKASSCTSRSLDLQL